MDKFQIEDSKQMKSWYRQLVKLLIIIEMLIPLYKNNEIVILESDSKIEYC